MIVKPDYYDKFVCIADQCDFTCCQEWKIAVDDRTNEAWKKMLPPEGTRGKRKNLSLYTTFKDGGRVIGLKNHVCPFLDKRKLCRLVITYGEESISETCHIFPREIHCFADRQEQTLMPCCPAVIDLMKEAEGFRVIADSRKTGQEDPLTGIRDFLMELAGDDSLTPEEILLAGFFVLGQFYDQENLPLEAARRDLPQVIAAIRELPVEEEDHFAECNELFLDLVENYRKESMYVSLLNQPAEEAEALSAQAGENERLSYPEAFAAEWQEFTPLLRKLLAEEFYSDLLIPDGDAESMMVKAEWIGMEYTLIRHLCYLKWRRDGQLTYEELRSYLVLACRMMGYEEEDIYEYMENSFADIIWDFGYMALIIGTAAWKV